MSICSVDGVRTSMQYAVNFREVLAPVAPQVA